MEKYILTNIIISENKVTINSLLTFRTFSGIWSGGGHFKLKRNKQGRKEERNKGRSLVGTVTVQ